MLFFYDVELGESVHRYVLFFRFAVQTSTIDEVQEKLILIMDNFSGILKFVKEKVKK